MDINRYSKYVDQSIPSLLLLLPQYHLLPQRVVTVYGIVTGIPPPLPVIFM